MSSIQSDGTHIQSKRSGEAVGHQGRKKSKINSLLIITDSIGIPVSCSSPIAGNHHDIFQLNDEFGSMFLQIQNSHIAVEGLFLNADSGFDTIDFRKLFQECEIFDNTYGNKRNVNENLSFFDDLLQGKR